MGGWVGTRYLSIRIRLLVWCVLQITRVCKRLFHVTCLPVYGMNAPVNAFITKAVPTHTNTNNHTFKHTHTHIHIHGQTQHRARSNASPNAFTHMCTCDYSSPRVRTGARYSGVPQKLCAPDRFSRTPSFDRPKSVSRTCPRWLRRTFSGLRSRYIMSKV